MISKNELLESLSQFNGTTQYYRYIVSDIEGLLTDGVKYLVESTKCYWLIDTILSRQISPVVSNHPKLKIFQIWNLTVSNSSATLSIEWDTNQLVEAQEIEYKDFLLDSIQLFCSPISEGIVIYLPSEY